MLILPNGDEVLTKYLGLTWIALLALAIAIRERIVMLNRATKIEGYAYELLSFGIAFFSGSALSFAFVHSIRSAVLSVSWPLIVILVLIIIVNEIVSTHTFRFMLDLAMLVIASLFNALIIAPFFFGTENEHVFDLTILITSSVVFLYMYLLQTLSDTARAHAPKGYALTIGIPLIITMLYSNSLIPTLVVSQSGNIKQIMTTGSDTKTITGERSIAAFGGETFSTGDIDGASTMVFTSTLHAPAGMSIEVSHTWEHYDELSKTWTQKLHVVKTYTINDTREESMESRLDVDKDMKGTWRITTLLHEKQVMGRTTFILK